MDVSLELLGCLACAHWFTDLDAIVSALGAPPPDLVFMNSASCPDPGLLGDFHRGWEGGVGARSGVSNGCSIGYWAGSKALETLWTG